MIDFNEILVTLIITLLGGGGIVSNIINQRRTKKLTNTDSILSKISALEDEHKEFNRKLANDFTRIENLNKKLDKVEDALNRNTEGTLLGLENDEVMFNYFRTNHINGESEVQSKKIHDYQQKCMKEVLHV